jgi:hypothetical protein
MEKLMIWFWIDGAVANHTSYLNVAPTKNQAVLNIAKEFLSRDIQQ